MLNLPDYPQTNGPEFIEPAKEFADIIIPNNRRNTVNIDIIKTIVHNPFFNSNEKVSEYSHYKGRRLSCHISCFAIWMLFFDRYP